MIWRAILVCIALSSLVGCDREERDVRLDPPFAEALDDVKMMPNGIGGAPPAVSVALGQPYTSNAYNLSQGKRLYGWFGCAGCHGDGSGASGPSFIDGWWAYGPDMQSIYVSIRDGRPNGMPSFKPKLTTEQIWQLAGYIRTIGSYSGSAAAPGRNDEKPTRPAENRA